MSDLRRFCIGAVSLALVVILVSSPHSYQDPIKAIAMAMFVGGCSAVAILGKSQA